MQAYVRKRLRRGSNQNALIMEAVEELQTVLPTRHCLALEEIQGFLSYLVWGMFPDDPFFLTMWDDEAIVRRRWH